MSQLRPPQNPNSPTNWSGQPEILAPFSKAWDWMSYMLFTTGDAGKWFGLGLCAFLTVLGASAGNGFNASLRFSESFSESAHLSADLDRWIDQNFPLFLLCLAALILFSIGIFLLVTFLSSRGQFMVVDGILNNRGWVIQPWRQFKKHGNALFRFQLLLALGILVFSVLFGGAAVLLIYVSGGIFGGSDSDFGIAAIIVMILGFGLLFLVGVLFGLFMLLLIDFAVPVMWLRGVGPTAALHEVQGLVWQHLGSFILYVLFRILLGIGIGITSFVIVCLTCCIAAIPYVGTVIMLPLFVLQRSFALYFLSQLHPDFFPFAPTPERVGGPGFATGADVGTDEPWAQPPQSSAAPNPSEPRVPQEPHSSPDPQLTPDTSKSARNADDSGTESDTDAANPDEPDQSTDPKR